MAPARSSGAHGNAAAPGAPALVVTARGAARRFLFWDRGPEGLCGLCLEDDDSELEEGMTRLNGRGLHIKTKRMDPVRGSYAMRSSSLMTSTRRSS